MAIIVEEEKRKINWAAIIGIFIIVVSIGTSVVYLFFVNPSQVEIFISPKLKSLSDFGQLEFNPDELMNNPSFKSLQSYVQFNVPQAGSPLVGKANPLIP